MNETKVIKLGMHACYSNSKKIKTSEEEEEEKKGGGRSGGPGPSGGGGGGAAEVCGGPARRFQAGESYCDLSSPTTLPEKTTRAGEDGTAEIDWKHTSNGMGSKNRPP